MAHVGISLGLSGDVTGRLRRMLKFAEKPNAAFWRGAIKAAREVIQKEFGRGGWFRPTGGFVSWPKGHDFGDRKAPAIPLGGLSGRLARAWNGGPGGFDRIASDGQSAVIGVSIPWAHVHRGGNSNPQPGRFTTIRPRRGQAMRYYLGLNLGVWLTRERMRVGLKVPTRPHATNNPETQKAIRALLEKALVNA